MRRTRKSSWTTLNRVSDLIELLITCHPQGFDVLLGEVEAPSSQEVHVMMNAGRSKMPEDFRATMINIETEAERIVYDREYFDKSVKLAGGWPHINYVSKEFKASDFRLWSVVMDHVKFVGNALTRNTSRLKRVAHKYGMSVNTVMKYRREFSMKLAEMIMMPPSDDGIFYLLPGYSLEKSM